jgi:hypothetical protein
MGVDIRLPNITATSADGQMTQMKSYLHQLVQQLNFALNAVNEAQSGNTSSVVMSKQSEDISPEEAVDTFNSIKSLIIKSADIVKAYEETIFTDFNGKYFAESDFGTYLATTNRKVDENSERSLDTFTKVETITNTEGTGSLDLVATEIRSTNAYIKRGLLGYHDRLKKDVYGIAVGQTDNGVYKRYAWFTAYGLSLFDENDNEVAYISQNKLYITDAVFLGTVQFGGYKMDTSDGLAFTWMEV